MIPMVIRELWEGSRQTRERGKEEKAVARSALQGGLYTFVSKHRRVNNSTVNI